MIRTAKSSARMDIDEIEVAERIEFAAQKAHAKKIAKASLPKTSESTAQIS